MAVLVHALEHLGFEDVDHDYFQVIQFSQVANSPGAGRNCMRCHGALKTVGALLQIFGRYRDEGGNLGKHTYHLLCADMEACDARRLQRDVARTDECADKVLAFMNVPKELLR
jgi:hypothetical protein